MRDNNVVVAVVVVMLLMLCIKTTIAVMHYCLLVIVFFGVICFLYVFKPTGVVVHRVRVGSHRVRTRCVPHAGSWGGTIPC
jgi:hypothetical protein